MTAAATDHGPLHTVRAVGFPLDVWMRSTQHFDELMREFALISAGLQLEDGPSRPVPLRLIDLVDELRLQFAAMAAQQDAQRQAALDAGMASVDLEYHVPAAAREAAASLLGLLDEADDFCRSGDLLTLASPAEAVRFREWYLNEVVRQIDGHPPTPWPEHAG